MDQLDDRHKSYWIASCEGQRFPALAGDARYDVAVIGGGITGLTAAWLLKRAGRRVVVIEALRVGGGNSGLTTAHLATALDTRYHKLVSDFGAGGARLAAESQRAAIERIDGLSRELGIDCGFRRVPGYLYAETAAGRGQIEQELEAVIPLGMGASLTKDVPLPFPVELALRFEDQAQFHPREYLLPLAARIDGDGCQVHEHTRVLEVNDGKPCSVVTEHGTITADDVIVAAHVPFLNRLLLHTKLAAYRSYVLGVRLELPPPPAGLYWDTAEPYHHLRTQPFEGGQLLIVGGEDHKTGQEEDTRAPFQRLKAYVQARFGPHALRHLWSGQIIETVDGLPYVGLNSRSSNVYVATGFAGNGMTHGTMAGMLLSDLILENPNPWASLYDARRVKPIAGIKDFVAENIDFPLHLVGDRLKVSEPRALDAIKPCEGKLVEIGGRKLAASRDATGALTVLSAVCPHLGCLVNWNRAESTWDCPCHGSRFSSSGEVLDGPAAKPLEPVVIEVAEAGRRSA